MKKIEAILRPSKLVDVRAALEKAGYPGLTLTEVEGHGKQKGLTQVFRNRKYQVDFLPKVKVEIVAGGRDAARIVKTILKAARTGKAGDGKIFVSSVETAYRVSSGEKGEKVVS
jgi:nitrogen regulatory protein P-II 1